MNPRSSKSPQAYISSRKYIKWGDNPASENTDTLVLTTPKKHYVDIRVLLPSPSSNNTSSVEIEWAFAGSSTSTPPTDTKPQHSQWTHWVDSKHPLGIEVQDAGDMYPQADGSTLEFGEMVNPATGKFERYEECWVDFDVDVVACDEGREGGGEGGGGGEGQGKRRGWTLRTREVESEDVRGMIVRVGQFIQGVVKRGGDVGVERWEFDGRDEKWKRLVMIGDGLGVDFDALISVQSGFSEGDVFSYSVHGEWQCMERFEW